MKRVTRFIPEGLVSEWRFQGLPGNNRGFITDQGLGGNRGTIIGRPALNFDAANEKAVAGTNFGPSAERRYFHYAGRVYLDASAAARVLLQIRFSGGNTEVKIFVSNFDALLVSVRGASGDSLRTLLSATLTEDQFIDIAVEIDSTDDVATVAVDGVVVTDASALSGVISAFEIDTPATIIFGLTSDDLDDFTGKMNLMGIGWDDTAWTVADYERFHDFPAAVLADKFGSGDAEYWLCDEGAGNPAGGNATSNLTLTGTDWDMGANGGLGFTAGLMTLDGTDDYVSIPDAANLRFSSGGVDKPFSLVVWATPIINKVQNIIAKGDFGTNMREWQMFTLTNEFIWFYIIHADDSSKRIGMRTTNAFVDGNMHLWGVTYNGNEANNGIVLYVDGAAVALTAAGLGAYTGMTADIGPVTLGAAFNSGAGTGFVTGDIAQAQIFDRALTSLKMAALYNQGAYR